MGNIGNPAWVHPMKGSANGSERETTSPEMLGGAEDRKKRLSLAVEAILSGGGMDPDSGEGWD